MFCGVRRYWDVNFHNLKFCLVIKLSFVIQTTAEDSELSNVLQRTGVPSPGISWYVKQEEATGAIYRLC